MNSETLCHTRTLSPMTVAGVNNSRSRKRKREFPERKLQINERVEVRDMEEGFLGSWNTGTVIHCGKLKRHVRYENVLDDDGLNHLVEVVSVSNALDRDISSSNCYERGLIRPLPPLIEFEKRDLKFGLCVDVNHQEAWWEGVIFDHCDGMEERSVFFPDLGDEMKTGVHQMRITQNWDEVTEKWEQRGNWVFLELIEKCERESYVAVSAKQIWYDVREKKDFGMIGDWTLNVRKDLWRDMVMEVVSDYWTLTVKEVFSALNLPELESVKLMSNVDLHMPFPEKEILEPKEPDLPVKKDLSMFQNEISCDGAGEVVSGAICFEKGQHRSSTNLRSNNWKPLILSEIESCSDAVKKYTIASKSKNKKTTRAFWKVKVQKHLAYLGWKIEWSESKFGAKHYRYKPPDEQGQKKVYYSLIKVCKVMQKESNMISFPSQNDHSIMHPSVGCHVPHVLLNSSKKIQDLDISPPIEPPPSVAVVDEQEYCPQAVVEYYTHAFEKNWADKRKWTLKAKKHLLAEGWIFDYPPPTNKRRRIIYMSPQNRRFQTLHVACRFCIEESIPKWTISGMQSLIVSAINEENVVQVLSDDLLRRVSQLLPKEPELCTTDGVTANGSTANQKQKCLRNSKARLLKRHSNVLPLPVLRSSKRVQKVSAPCLSHQKPLNVLSWLIDSNMVLPRSKVYYRAKGRHIIMAEGRITRDGIKCNCCLTIYSLVGFENHASSNASSSSTHRPSASIFLEDGRSLLDCQIQIMQDHETRETMEKPFSDLFQGKNDYICSVCHYGGELILCDQCPSSFHKMCLGLEDIPDGDWFCPSCRCGICGQSKINGDEDGHFLTCIQCEHKYHVVCLKNRDIDESRRYLENWFCGKDCQKIHAGLHKLLGEPVSVGVDNLTWTLMKFVSSQSCDLDSTKSDLLAESYSKLNVALSVMHESFEPLKESSSSRDLMEDVIFSRWSDLNRLNFRGFYTVLLERNEELICVATVRVYGEKLAEIPLVGTRLQYRRHGMCHILMNELEKKLMQLGVERLVLPAVPSVLETWTGSFGFSKMTSFERSQFLDYTFLDFQGTVMCQKLLMKIPSPDSIEFRQKQDAVSGSCSANFDKSIPVSEAYQGGGEIDKRGMLDQQMVDTYAGNNDHLGSGAIDSVTMVKQPSPEVQQCQNGTSPPCSFAKWNGSYRYYKRRKVKRHVRDQKAQGPLSKVYSRRKHRELGN